MSIGDQFKALVFEHTGIKAEDLQCPREKSDMTPCVARDGDCAMTNDEHCVGCGQSVALMIEKENERFGGQSSSEEKQKSSSEMGEAELRGKLFADAIGAMTDLFYQVDTRHRFMTAFLQRLKEIMLEMEKDRQERRAKDSQ